MIVLLCVVVFCQAEDGIRDLVRSRGLGDVYKRQVLRRKAPLSNPSTLTGLPTDRKVNITATKWKCFWSCLLYTSDAADERSSVDLGGRRIIKKKKKRDRGGSSMDN